MNYRTRKEDDRRLEDLSKSKIKCKNCGHIMILARQPKILCTYCGRYIFKNDAEEFKYRLMEKIGKKYE